MQLQLRPDTQNRYPLGGILIQGASAADWLRELQGMGIALEQVAIYPLPGAIPNSIWGCLVECAVVRNKLDIGKHSFCQQVNPYLFIAEQAQLYPRSTPAELEQLLFRKKHLLHPAIGLVELPEPLRWEQLLVPPTAAALSVVSPEPPVFIPTEVRGFLIQQLSAEEVLQQLAENTFPKAEAMDDQPLNFWEKSKLFFYRQLLFKKAEEEAAAKEGKKGANLEKTGFLKGLESLKNLFSKKDEQWTERMQRDYEALEARNRRSLERLMEMLKNDPEEALKYAIPLDETGLGRGKTVEDADFSLWKRRDDFSIWEKAATGTGSGVGGSLPSDDFNKLQQEYHETARKLIAQGKYQKAAFVYMRLLKNHQKAAETLELGKLYAEAASVYLKLLNNKPKAAECYEKANMILNAIELHKELGNDEKVGDLYVSIGKHSEAVPFYEKVIEGYKGKQQFLKASLIYRDKLLHPEAARATLLEGWRGGYDAFNCLNNYFHSFDEDRALRRAIEQIYAEEVNEHNRVVFLDAIKLEYGKRPDLAEFIREIGYEIIVQLIRKDPMRVGELPFFNPKDTLLQKDTMRFRVLGKR